MNKVYLAGGIRSNWQVFVKEACPELIYFNPRDKEVDNPLTLEEYSTWDLHHIKLCDIVFGFMEKNNPSGIGMSVELGYAKGLNKTVILCIEPNNEFIKESNLNFLKKAADITFAELNIALHYLKLYQ